MKVEVRHINNVVACQFMPYGNGLRLWVTDDGWYKSVNWCPHINIGAGECLDCALVLEGDNDN